MSWIKYSFLKCSFLCSCPKVKLLALIKLRWLYLNYPFVTPCVIHPFFYKNQKILAEPRYCYVFAQFEPQLFLNCSCFDRVNYTLRHCHRSFSLVFKNTCGTVLIFFSAHSVFITDDHLTFRGGRFFRSAGNCFQRHLACKKFFAV